MEIKKLEKLKNEKYKLFLDDGTTIVTYDDIIIKNMLFVGKKLDNKLLSEISINNDYYQVYYKIVKMISTKWRSEKEVVDYLNKNEVSLKNQGKILTELKKNNLINDLRYASSYAVDAVSLRKNGPHKIEDDLRKLGIDEKIIDQVLKSLDYEQIDINLEDIILKKNKLNKSKSLFQLKMSLKNELMRLGYEEEKINKKLSLLKDDSSIYKKEYERLYNKYSKKYSGKELEYKVKQALYQKGFHYNEF